MNKQPTPAELEEKLRQIQDVVREIKRILRRNLTTEDKVGEIESVISTFEEST